MASDRRPHRIQRATLEWTFRDEGLARAILNRMGSLHRQAVAPVLDSVCSELADPDRRQRIERLEVDLGELDPHHLESQLASRLRQAFRSALAAALPRGVSSDAEVEDSWSTVACTLRHGWLPWWAADQGDEALRSAMASLLPGTGPAEPHPADPRVAPGSVHHRGPNPSISRNSIDDPAAPSHASSGPGWPVGRAAPDGFVERPAGRRIVAERRSVAGPDRRANAWPPDSNGAALVGFDQTNASSGAGGADPSDPVAPPALRRWRRLLGEPWVRRRLVLRTSERELTALVERIAPVPHLLDRVGALVALLVRAAGIAEVRARRVVWTEVLAWATGDGSAGGHARVAPILDRVADHLVWHVTAQLGVDAMQLATALEAPIPEVDERLTREWLRPAVARLSSVPRAEGARAVSSARARPENPARSRSVFPDHGVVVSAAGIVLLWPFLERFFEGLGLVQERALVDGTAQQRATGLLHVVATGNPDPTEPHTTLHKVLCGLPPDEVFDFGQPATPEELTECEGLLEAVLDLVSPAFGGLSVDGLRRSFLFRRGLLDVRDGAWLLRVDGQSHDILLTKVPWSWTWVKLPWMPHPLRVEW